MAQFGDKITLKVSPALVLALGDELSRWVLQIAELDEIDLEREANAKAQKLVNFIHDFSLEQQ